MSTVTHTLGDREVPVVVPDDFTGPLPDLTGDCWRELADENASNDLDSMYVFRLSEAQQLEIYCEQGYPAIATVEPVRSISHVIKDLNPGDLDMAQFLAEWKQDPFEVLQKAPEGYEGPCRVWHEPCYYQGTYNAPLPGYAQDDKGNILEFENYEEAAAYVHEYYHAPSGYDGIPACNVLSHGQAGADTLTIVKA